MIRLAFSVEGPTERDAIRQVVGPHLQQFDIWVYPIPLGAVGRRGPVNLDRVCHEVRGLLGSHDAVTTFYDFYRFQDRRDRTCDQLQAAILERLGGDGRLVPYVQQHEFEALCFSDPGVAAQHLCIGERQAEAAAIASGMRRILGEVGPPEDIDHGYHTCPSRRLKSLHPGYDKVRHGPGIVAAIGLPRLRAACPRFGAWVSRLEGLGRPFP